jgi:SAM-dependent methyltransferase
MSPGEFPVPPASLANYVGRLTSDDPEREYLAIGRTARSFVEMLLPDDFSLDGARILDFGCGSGRVLRHFAPEAESGEAWGCDIDAASIEWATANLTPPLRFVGCDEVPPLPFADEYFDLIYAISVFTHLTDSWSAWLLELRRILRPGGMLVVSFLGRGMSMAIALVPWTEDEIGMLPAKIGTPWSEGGPCVLHSPWWLRAHFGRAFEIHDLVEDGTGSYAYLDAHASGRPRPSGPPGNPPGDGGHGLIALLRDDRPAPTLQQLEAPEPREPREWAAMRFGARHLEHEIALWRGAHDHQRARADELASSGGVPQPGI